ncbi:MAG TPA: PfkB family carbohydrate kinase [Devosiaceae bacterium]
MTNILVAGSAVVDFVFMLDEMPRQPEKYRAREAAIVGGGCAANAAVAIARLGGHPQLAVVLGEDEVGEMIVAGLESEGVDCHAVRRVPGHRSSFSSVFIDAAGERQIVNYRDRELAETDAYLPEIGDMAFGAVLSDTRWPIVAAHVMREARRRGVPGILDAEAPVALAREALDLATHIAFSAQGLREYAGVEDLERGLHIASERTGAFICVTDGADGVFHLDGGDLVNTPAFQVKAIDTLGAGDVWHGAFALALVEGSREAHAIRFANAVAAIKCTRTGGRAGSPTRSEVEQFLKEQV